MSTRDRIVLACLVFAGFIALGASVSHVPPGALDRSELASYGLATPLARFLTNAGRFPVYFSLSMAALIFGFVRRAWLGRVLVAVVGLVVVWQTSDLAKLYFHRARPPHPIVAETSFGYPSGHADLAIFFYGLWAFYAWHTALPKPLRSLLVGLLALWTLAIGWSRLALGAHFPTDVFGGYLFGGGFLSLAIAASNSVRNVRHTLV